MSGNEVLELIQKTRADEGADREVKRDVLIEGVIGEQESWREAAEREREVARRKTEAGEREMALFQLQISPEKLRRAVEELTEVMELD